MTFTRIAAVAACALTLAIAFAGPASAATPRWLAPQDVGDARPGQSPVARADKSGRGIVAWIADAGDGNSQILARRFTQKSGPAGSILDLSGVIPSPTSNFSLNRMDAVVAPDGTATVAWRQNDQRLLARRVSTGGVVGPVLELSDAANFGVGIFAAAAVDGSVAVAFTHRPEGGNSAWPQIIRIAPNGTPGSAVDLAAPAPFNAALPSSITADSRGRFWALWSNAIDSDNASPFEDIEWKARRLSSDGSTLGAEVTLDRLGGLPDSACSGEIRTDANDRALASWSMAGAGASKGIRARSIASDGATLGPIATLDPNVCKPSDVDMTSDGTAIVAWTRPLTAGAAIVTRTVTADGKVGPERLLASGPDVPAATGFAELAPSGAGSVQALYVGAGSSVGSRGLTTGALGPEQKLQPAGPAVQPFLTSAGPNAFAGAWVSGANLAIRLARTVSGAKPPAAKVAVEGDSAGNPILTSRVATKAPSDPLAALTTVNLTLPAKLGWASKASKLVTVKADGKKVSPVAVTIKGRTLTASVPAGAKTVDVTTKGAALTIGQSARCPSSVKPGKSCLLRFTFDVKTTDVSGDLGTAKPTATVTLLA